MGITSGTARAAAGIVALIAWIGIAVQFEASLARAGSAAATLWVMLRYFTIISNLLAAIVFTGIALGKPRFSQHILLGGVTLAMLLVGIVYWLLLRGLLELSGGAWLADLLLHSVTTVLVPLYWLVFAPRGGLKRTDPLIWMALPLVYFAYALIRGAFEGVYAYPFMDVAKIGWGQTSITAVLMALGFLVAGYAMVWLDRAMDRRT